MATEPVLPQLRPRIVNLTSKRWRVSKDGKALEAYLRFPTFKKTWDFMALVAAKAATRRHHPEWANVYNKVFIRWTTHEIGGISDKDVEMAEVCDEFATSQGVKEEAAEGSVEKEESTVEALLKGIAG